MKKIKNYAMALVALVIAATSATLMSFNKLSSKTSQSTVTLFFQGDTEDPNDIQDASKWVEQETSPACDGDEKACSISVDPSDVTSAPIGSRELNPSRITLNASPGVGGHYIPQKNNTASSSPNLISVHNQDL